MGGFVCIERKPAPLNKSTTHGTCSKSKLDKSKITTPIYDEVPGISISDKSATNNVIPYETIRCSVSKKNHKINNSSSLSDDKSYAKVLGVKENMSTKESKTYETVRSFPLTDSQSISSDTRGSTRYTSIDQVRQVRTDVCGTEQYSGQYYEPLHDMCTLCASKCIAVQATHICINCSKYGRYFCYECLHLHNSFIYDHDVRSLSAPIDDKRSSNIQAITKQGNKRSNSAASRNTSRRIRSQNTREQPEREQHDQSEIIANLSTEHTRGNYNTSYWVDESTNWKSDRPSVHDKEEKEIEFPYRLHWNPQAHNCSNVVQNKQLNLMNWDENEMNQLHEQTKYTDIKAVSKFKVSTQHNGCFEKAIEQRTGTGKSADQCLKHDEVNENEVNERYFKATDNPNAENTNHKTMSLVRHSPKLRHSYQVKRNKDLPSLQKASSRHESVNRSIKTQFLELYDKEWADSFKALVHTDKGNKTEQQACELLLRVLIDIYLICKEKVQINSKSMISISPKDKTDDLQDDKRNDYKEISQATNHSLRNFLPQEERKLISRFITKCTGVCFTMASQGPYCLDTNTDRHGEHFDTSQYKTYRLLGTTIDYIVWPVLYLEDDNTIVNKGIAQLKGQ